jgi:tRNA threonylcarbamoyladenosine biosynthesis protein TsaE
VSTSLTFHLADENATLAIGAKLAKICPTPCVIYLVGDLGAGKTTFARGFLRGFGYREKVKSPTYTLVESYHFDKQSIFHFDLYRLMQPEELELIGIRDYFSQPAIHLIEWPERAVSILPEADLNCYIRIVANAREITMQAHTESGKHVLSQIQNID